tara:strand:+ start:46 stop:765 length:720 start_codon:yes stop_codon:yes gene_type:complete
MQKPKEYQLELLEIIQETPKVKLFKFKFPDDPEFYFYPGQFIMLSFINDPDLKVGRAYSLASSPENKEFIEIGLDKIAKFTTKLFSTKPGTIMKVKGPFGKFYFNEEIKNDIVLIGAGTGITPLVGVMRYATDKQLKNKIKLIYSSKKPELIIYNDEIEQLKSLNNNIDSFITITRPESDYNGPSGRLNENTLKEQINDFKDKIYFLCGSNDFVKCMISILNKNRVTKEQIKTDVWGNQ